jgi:hypothetical protein
MRIVALVGLIVGYCVALAIYLIACGVMESRAEPITLKGENWDKDDWASFAFFTTVFQVWIVIGSLWFFLWTTRVFCRLGIRLGDRMDHRRKAHEVALAAANIRIAELETELAKHAPFSYRLTNGDKDKSQQLQPSQPKKS